MDFIFPFPVLHIQRPGSNVYEWGITCDHQPLEQDVGLSSIEECLQGACHSLGDDVLALEVRYRGVSVGTFQANAIRNACPDVADQIVSRFEEAMNGIAYNQGKNDLDKASQANFV